MGQGALMLLWVCRVCPDYWLLYIRMEGSYMFAVRAFQLKSMQECVRREVIGCMAAEILKENCFVFFFLFLVLVRGSFTRAVSLSDISL